MLAIKKARKLIEADPHSLASQTLASLVVALESEGMFSLHALYQLEPKPFELALEILKEWRLDRYYASKLKLMDLSALVTEQTATNQPSTVDGEATRTSADT